MQMSSRDIAEVTGKRHDNVVRDIRSVLKGLEDDSNLSHQQKQGVTEHKDARGYTSHFLLDRRHVLCVISKYSDKLRMAIIDRLHAVETGEATPWHMQEPEPEPAYQIPQSYAEALRLAADETERADVAEAALEDATERLEFITVRAYLDQLNQDRSRKYRQRLGQKAKELTLNSGRRIRREASDKRRQDTGISVRRDRRRESDS